MRRRSRTATAALLLTGLLLPVAATAQDRHALVIFGAPGGEKYAGEHARWSESIATTLHDRFGFAKDGIVVLWHDAPGERASTRENVTRLVEDLERRVGPDDLVLIVLVGHGTVDATSAKFNLTGPDLDDREWAALVRGIPGRLVFINAASASFPFLQRLAAPNRIVITATDSSAQRFYTVFPEYLIEALADPAADLDRNNRVSIWEVFSAASAGVKQHYERRGQLATERPIFDDDGDGKGSEADAKGPDGALARTTYLDADPVAADDDPETAGLLERQRRLEREAEELKLRKSSMPLPQWEAEFEKLMIELARVSRAIRSRS